MRYLEFFGKWLSKKRKPHVLWDCYGNIHTLTNNFVSSVFVKVYRRVYQKVEVKLLFFFIFSKFSKFWYRILILKKKMELGNVWGVKLGVLNDSELIATIYLSLKSLFGWILTTFTRIFWVKIRLFFNVFRILISN